MIIRSDLSHLRKPFMANVVENHPSSAVASQGFYTCRGAQGARKHPEGNENQNFIKDGIKAHIYNVFNLFHICGLSHLHIDKLEFTNSKGAHQILLCTLFLSGVKSPFWDTN